MWITNMLISWSVLSLRLWKTSSQLTRRVSATNASRSYEMSLSQRDKNRDMLEKLRFVTVLTVENIWDAFILYTLIGQHERDRRILVVDHEHDQNVRFKELMEERNEHVIMHGQDEVDHYCDKCTKFWVDADGIDRKYFVRSPSSRLTILRRCLPASGYRRAHIRPSLLWPSSHKGRADMHQSTRQ